jgi:hypothetical protein
MRCVVWVTCERYVMHEWLIFFCIPQVLSFLDETLKGLLSVRKQLKPAVLAAMREAYRMSLTERTVLRLPVLLNRLAELIKSCGEGMELAM